MKITRRDGFGDYPKWQDLPYGARIEFEVAGNYLIEKDDPQPSFIGIWNEASLIISKDLLFRFRLDKQKFQHEDANVWSAYIEGFESASEAEQMGTRFSAALLLWSLMQGPSLRLRYQTSHPCEVYSRRLPTERRYRSFTSATLVADSVDRHNEKVGVLREVWSGLRERNVSEKLFLALELYASSAFERSRRARFLTRVSVIEALAEQKDYRKLNSFDINRLIEDLVDRLKAKEDCPDSIKSSLEGKINNLHLESVRRACKRLIREHLPNEADVFGKFDDAYGVRSKIVHEGEAPGDLHKHSSFIGQLARKLLVSVALPEQRK